MIPYETWTTDRRTRKDHRMHGSTQTESEFVAEHDSTPPRPFPSTQKGLLSNISSCPRLLYTRCSVRHLPRTPHLCTSEYVVLSTLAISLPCTRGRGRICCNWKRFHGPRVTLSWADDISNRDLGLTSSCQTHEFYPVAPRMEWLGCCIVGNLFVRGSLGR